MGNKSNAAPAPGHDNNKRLAALEAGVSSLAVALAAAGVTVGEGDPIELAIATIGKSAEEANDGALEALKARIAELEAKGEQATPGEIAAIARADNAEDLVRELDRQIEELQAEIDRINASESDGIVSVAVERERPEGARDLGPDIGGLDYGEIATLRTEGRGVEIAFSNGEYEIVGMAPIAFSAAELVPAEGRFIAPTVHVKGGEVAESIHGAALTLDGEQIAYCTFPTPIGIEAHQERRFDRAIIFGDFTAPKAIGAEG